MPLAMAYATFLLCENKKEDDACGVCANCQRMQKLIHPDVHYFFPGSRTEKEKDKSELLKKWREFICDNHFPTLESLYEALGTENKQNQIGREDARDIIRTVSMKSFEGNLKIIFIWCPERLNSSAANAILKVLEEPPEQTVYILVSHDYEGVIPTILSRTQLVTIPPVTHTDIADYLKSEKNIPQDKAEYVARLSEGSFAEAMKLTVNENDLNFQGFQKWMQACYKQDHTFLVKRSEEFQKSSKSDQRAFLIYGISLIRNAIVSHADPNLVLGSGQEKDFVVNFGKTLSQVALESIYTALGEVHSNLLRNANPRISFLSLSLRISGHIHSKVLQ